LSKNEEKEIFSDLSARMLEENYLLGKRVMVMRLGSPSATQKQNIKMFNGKVQSFQTKSVSD
jgi:hypothetical protein